jgi:hypothetical protein
MLILLDNAVPRGIKQSLSGHVVTECRERAWDTLSNGELLTAAEAAGFEVLVTTDKNIRYQQNLTAGRSRSLCWAADQADLGKCARRGACGHTGSYTEIRIPD